jgi:isopentenyldiphosphate isomerase
MPSEWVDLIDEQNCVIGWARRGHVRALNLLHRGVGILCADSRARIYVHRRTATKDVFPGLYDMLVGGVVTRGEDYDAAARREIAEELGIIGPEPRWLCDYLYQGPLNRSWIRVYAVTWDGEIRHQLEEIDWGEYLSREELEAKLQFWRFVPDGLEIYRHLERQGYLDRALMLLGSRR